MPAYGFPFQIKSRLISSMYAHVALRELIQFVARQLSAPGVAGER